MADIYSPEPGRTERFSDQTDSSLIEAVQQRSRLLETNKDPRNPAIRAGNRAFAELLKRYDRWLWKQVHAFSGIDLNEAYSKALQGFEKAITKFDLSRGYSLVSFAAIVVRRLVMF